MKRNYRSHPELAALPTLDDLAAAPERVVELSPADAWTLLARAGSAEAVLRARVATAPPTPNHNGAGQPDRLLTADEVALRLGLREGVAGRKAVYRRARHWPFTRRPSEGTLRFSEAGLAKFLAGKRS